MKHLSYLIVLTTFFISVVNAAPPGLYNNDTPPGLHKHEGTPYGWTQGKKVGWDKHRFEHRHHRHHHDIDDIHH